MPPKTGNLLVEVRASAEQYSADLRQAKTRTMQFASEMTSTTGAISASWGKTGAAANDAIAKMEKRGAGRAVQRDLQGVTENIIGNWGKAGRAAEEAGKHTEHSMRDAHEALKLVEEMIGVHLPQATAKFLTHSTALGPILKAAFSTLAIIGFVEVLAEIPEIYEKLVAGVTGWNDAAKKAYEQQLQINEAYLRVSRDIEVSLIKRQEQFGGLSAVDATKKQVELLQKEFDVQQNILNKEGSTLAVRKEQESTIGRIRGALGGGLIAGLFETKSTEELTESYKTATDKAKEFGTELTKLRSEMHDTEEALGAAGLEDLAHWFEHASDRAKKFQDIEKGVIKDHLDDVKERLAADTDAANLQQQRDTATMKRIEAVNRGRIGLEQDITGQITKIDLEAERQRFAAVQASFAGRIAAAHELERLGGPENRVAAADAIDDVGRDREAAARQHTANIVAIEQTAAQQIAVAEADLAQFIKDTYEGIAQAEATLRDHQLRARLSMDRVEIAGEQDVRDAEIAAERSASQNRVSIAEATSKLLNVTASRAVAMRLDSSLEGLDAERQAVVASYDARLRAMQLTMRAEERTLADDVTKKIITQEQYNEALAKMNTDQISMEIKQGQDLATIDARVQQAQLGARLENKQRQDAIVESLAGNITKLFSDRLTDSSTSFWEAFTKLGRDAIGGITSFFLNNLLKGILDPFKEGLDSIVQEMGASLRNLFTKNLLKNALGGSGGGDATSGLGGIFGKLLGGSKPVAGALMGGVTDANAMGGTLGLGVAGAGPGISAGGGLLGLSATGWGAILAGGILAATVLPGLLHGGFKAAPQVGVDPFEKQKDRTFWFNSTFPFEKLTQALNKIDATLDTSSKTQQTLADTVSTLSTADPGMVMQNNFAAIKEHVQDAVVIGATQDRTYRRSLSGAVLDQAL